MIYQICLRCINESDVELTQRKHDAVCILGGLFELENPTNFSGVNVLLAHGSQTVANLHESMLRGFGVNNIITTRTARGLEVKLCGGQIDLAIIDNSIGATVIPGIIQKLRRNHTACERDTPVLLSYCHTNYRNILVFRDSGANMVMSLPFTVKGIYDRLSWIASRPRPFVISEQYCGPCRRVGTDKSPTLRGRRREDKNQRVGMQCEADEELTIL